MLLGLWLLQEQRLLGVWLLFQVSCFLNIHEQSLLGFGLHLSGADLETNIVPGSLAGSLLVRYLWHSSSVGSNRTLSLIPFAQKAVPQLLNCQLKLCLEDCLWLIDDCLICFACLLTFQILILSVADCPWTSILKQVSLQNCSLNLSHKQCLHIMGLADNRFEN